MKSEDCDFFVARLKQLMAMCERYGFGPIAELGELIALCAENPTRFLYRVTSAEVWGSAGSVWDTSFAGNAQGVDIDVATEDDKQWLRLLLEVAEQAVTYGDPGGAGKRALIILRGWRDQGILD